MLFVLKMTYLIMPACPEPCCADSPDSPTFAKPCCADSPNSPTFAELCCADSPNSPTFANHLPSTRQTRRHSPNAIFEKNVTRLATFAQVIRHSREFGASGHCLVLTFFSVRYILPLIKFLWKDPLSSQKFCF
jgi:hypothetical protein